MSYPLTLKKPLFLIPSVVSKTELDKANGQENIENTSTGQIEASVLTEGRSCKYCDEFIEGNHGAYLAHVRKCPKRTEGK